MQLTLDLNQRWTGGRATYRRPDDPIRTSEYDVAVIRNDTVARQFVETHHYSKTYPAARFRIGLYHRGELVGVAVFSHPCSDKVLTNVFPVAATDAVELGRFVLLDKVPGNGETWFLARAFDILRSNEIAGVVSFSDPLPRKTVGGATILMGHIGTIYQGSNMVYLGRGTPRTLHLLPDCRVFSDRTAQKIRKGESGWRYAAAQLESFGARPVPDCPEARVQWLKESLQALTTSVRHRGNHKYAWALRKGLRSSLPVSLPYPKSLDVAV